MVVNCFRVRSRDMAARVELATAWRTMSSAPLQRSSAILRRTQPFRYVARSPPGSSASDVMVSRSMSAKSGGSSQDDADRARKGGTDGRRRGADDDETAAEPASKRKSRMRQFVADYGALGLVSWTGLWAIGIPMLYVPLLATDNFGLDPLQILDWLNVSREQAASLVGVEVDPSEDSETLKLSPKATALVLSVFINEALEPLRWVILIPLVRALKRRQRARQASKSDKP